MIAQFFPCALLFLLANFAGLYAGEGEPVCLARGKFESNTGFRGLLARELVRQSFLIAARDELGLPTRDEVLGEPFAGPAGPLDASKIFSLEARIEGAEPEDVLQNIPTKFLRPADKASEGKTGLSGTYFNGMNFQTQVLKRLDANVQFSWKGKPAEGVNPDQFSVRWEGFLEVPEDGEYGFVLQTDDGARLWINNEKIIDEWRDQGITVFNKTAELKAGSVPVKLEYFENTGDSEIYLAWSRPVSKKKTPALLRVTIKQGQKTLGEPLTAPIAWPGPELYRSMMEKCEEWSRTEFPARLKAAGYAALPPLNGPAIDPAKVDAVLGKTSLAPTYLALRMLHQASREKDLTGWPLPRLSLGYALLSWTAGNSPTASAKVSAARALLYGLRAKALAKPGTPGQAEASFALGIAYSTAGLPNWAVKECAAARELWGAQKPLPGWAEVMTLAITRDSAKLALLCKPGTSPWSNWAAVLHANFIMSTELSSAKIKELRQQLRNYPESDVLYDMLLSNGDISTSHEVTTKRPQSTRRQFAQSLSAIPGLPAELKELAVKGNQAGLDNTELVAAQRMLTKAAPADTLEPSLAALQVMFSNDCLFQIGRRARFMISDWAVGYEATRKYLDEDEMLLDTSPFRPLLKMYRFEFGSQQSAIKKELQSVKFADLNCTILAYLNLVAPPVPDCAPFDEPSKLTATTQTDWTSGSLSYLINDAGTMHESYMTWMNELDANSPNTLIWTIWFKGSRNPAILAEIEKRPNLPPAVMNSITEFYEHMNNSAKVLEWSEKLAQLRPDLDAWSKLAWRHHVVGNDKKYLELMERALTYPDQGLSHARLNTQMASVLRIGGDYKKSIKYAETAAKSWAQWAMQEAVWCYEADGQYDKAAEWGANVSKRYELPDWYFQTVLYGKDKAQPLTMVQEQIKARGGNLGARECNTQGWMFWIEGDTDKAIANLEAAYKNYQNASDAGAIAVFYGQKNLPEKRQHWLAESQKGDPGSFADTKKVASICGKALKANQPLPKDEILRVTEAVENRWQTPSLCFISGHLLLQGGDKDAAIRLFKKGMNAATGEYRFKAACAKSLRALGDAAELKTPLPPVDKNAAVRPPEPPPGDF